MKRGPAPIRPRTDQELQAYRPAALFDDHPSSVLPVYASGRCVASVAVESVAKTVLTAPKTIIGGLGAQTSPHLQSRPLGRLRR
jgi:hypothetical protein